MSKIDFVVVGAQKAGTTSLYKILRKHQDIYLPEEKEFHFFDKNPYPQTSQIVSYFERFSEAKKQSIKGEITPDYLFYGYVPENIKKFLGDDIKIIAILRNPAKRAYSQFNFHRMKGVERTTDFMEIIKEEQINNNVLQYDKWYSPPYYLSRGMYYNQVSRFINCFGKEKVHVIIFEKLFGENYNEELEKLLNFIGVNTEFKQETMHEHPTKLNKSDTLFTLLRMGRWVKNVIGEPIYQKLRVHTLDKIQKKPPSLSKENEKEIIYEYFLNDIKKLEDLVEKDLKIWYE
ncbi:MAG: sulfotransferase domain-containing protein [Fulvivirga sp.]|uniref:sulfotransferase domain-containing protein n=1 Tax=Fulvivirga sp. TaxID=1931237 RepID=UPI0032ED2029